LLQSHIEDISADNSIAIVAVVGDRMKGTTGISAKVFGAMGAQQINVIAISQGSSEVNISLIVAAKDAANAVLAIHQAFELHKPASE
jgi:aspartokinase